MVLPSLPSSSILLNNYFFESDQKCHAALDARIKTRATGKNVKVVFGDCNEMIHELQPSPSALGVAFIDPTNIASLPFRTIRRMTDNRRLDLIINFSEGMGIRMNIHQHTKKEGGALDNFLDSERWRRKFKQAPLTIDAVCREIADEYQQNLRKLGYGVFDGDQIPIRADKNQLLYYLLFASKHPKGNEFWRKIALIDAHGRRKFTFPPPKENE